MDADTSMSLAIEHLLSRAAEAYTAGNYEDAERLYRSILLVEPQHPDANHILGLIAVGAGNLHAGLSLFKAAVTYNPGQRQFWISYINGLIKANQLTEAATVLQEARGREFAQEYFSALEVKLVEARQMNILAAMRDTGRLNLEQSSKEQTTQELAMVRAKAEAHLKQEIDRLLSLYNSRSLPAAEQLAVTLCRDFPTHPFAWKVLGAVRKLSGQMEASLEPMRQAVRLAPNDAEARSNLGVILKELGHLSEAESNYIEAIRIKPNYAEANNNFGVMLQELKRLPEAEARYRVAIQHNPHYAEAHSNLGNLLSDMGRLPEAEACYKAAIALKPDYPEAHNNLGNLFKELGDFSKAEASYREAIRLRPTYPEAHNNLGVIFKNLGRFIEAAASCQEAIRLKRDYASAHSNLGNVFKDLARLPEAEACYREAIRINPGLAEAHNNRGVALGDLGRLTEAEVSCREAIRLKPDYAEAHNNLGNILLFFGRLIEAEENYREAIRIKPGYAAAHSNLGNVLGELGRLLESEASYRKAIQINPEFAEAHNNLGSVLADLGRPADAEVSYRAALRIDPDLANSFSNILFNLNYLESLAPESTLLEAQRYGALVSTRAQPKYKQWRIDRESSPLRVGFVSGDLRNHPVGYFVEGLITHLDRSQFELVAFPTTPKADELTARLQAQFSRWIPVYGKSDADAARAIHEQGIQVLIDLSGHTAHNRLPVFSYKPAPVQASWLGYFATTGLPEMDYFIGDPQMSPPSEAGHFSERIWNLAETWLCLLPPGDSGPLPAAPALRNGYVTFGCFSNLSKINEQVVKTWAEILRRAPTAKLFLKSKQLTDAQVVAEVQSRFACEGVSADRLILEGPSARSAYLEAYSRIDVVLDTFPYPGGTTSVDALWMGVPVLALKGDRFLSHLGESIAQTAGQGSWIAADRASYIDRALALASDPGRMGIGREALRERVLKTPLFDMPRFAKNFGAALSGMWCGRST